MASAPSAPVDPRTGLSAARFGVYVHFPYCLSKCPYCDFASVVAKAVPEEAYLRAMQQELALRVEAFGASGREVHSVYVGGGTPSLWAPRWAGALLETLAKTFRFAPGLEVTLEANPGASDAARFSDFKAAGFNRLSIGVQSFRPRLLAALGRAHDGPQAVRAVEAARKAGFENVSVDLIYGVQTETVAEALDDAARAVALSPEHVSAYALTLDKASLAEEVPLAKQLARGEVALPPDEQVIEMQRAFEETLSAAGLSRYEVSNYARAGFHSRHNALYWTGGEYLALGAGATGTVGRLRYSNHRSVEKWFEALGAKTLPHAGEEPLDDEALCAERVAMGLRLTSGVALEDVLHDFGRTLGAKQAVVARLVREGFAEVAFGRLRLTSRGFDVHSAIAAALL